MRAPVKSSAQRGVAVVTALLLTTLSITIVASLFWQQQVQVRSIENQRLQLQKQWILRGALDWASLILRADQNVSGDVDFLGEPWSVPLAETRLDQYVENGRVDGDASDATLSGSIVDAFSRYNLTNLATNGTVLPYEVVAFQRLLSFLRLDPALAKATADTIAAGQDKPLVQQDGTSPQAAPPQKQSNSRPMKIEYVDDLLAVPGFTHEILAKLKDYVIVLPEGQTPINLNTASAEVLAAKVVGLTLTDAKVYVARRETAHFRTQGEFNALMQGKDIDASNCVVNSSYFLVNGKVRMNRAGLEVQALIKRTNNTSEIKWIRES